MVLMLLLLLFISTLTRAFPNPWINYHKGNGEYYQDTSYAMPEHYGELMTINRPTRHITNHLFLTKNNEFVEPMQFGNVIFDQLKPSRVDTIPSSSTTFGNLIYDGIMAGYNLLDRTVPQINTKESGRNNPITTLDLQNFARPRRHEEEHSKKSLEEVNMNITIPTTTTTEITTTNIAEQPIMEEKISKVDSNQELEEIITQLNNALEYIKKHKVEKEKIKPIDGNTPTEEIVKYISGNVDILSKTKNNETRTEKIKEVSNGLDILLNRIAKSALAKKNITKITNHTDTGDIMLRIVRYVTEAKKEALAEKIRNGVEMNSNEIDGNVEKVRPIRQEDDSANNIDGDVEKEIEEVTEKNLEASTMKTLEVTARQEESEEQSSSQEGGGNLVANLLGTFLGSLSKPDGGVDVDAIVGLVSGLSVQRDDGTFDFSGITDLLQSFLGGDEEGGGGSDVGAFLGGLLGAIIQGSANPPGAKGTGKLTGNLIANILPGLSGPPPATSSEEAAGAKPHGGLDSGSFLAGLLTSMLGASSGTSSSSGKHSPPVNNSHNGHGHDYHGHDYGSAKGSGQGSASFLIHIKNGIFKSIVSIITSVLGSSSHGSSAGSHGGHGNHGKH